MVENPISLQDGDIQYWPTFFPADEAAAYAERLITELPWSQHEVRIGAKVIPAPRLSSWHGDPGITYGYSGARYTASGWPPAIAAIKARVQAGTGHRFNSVLANLYRDGQDGMGWHADREPELGPEPVIASVSFGATRKFMLKHRNKKATPRVDLWLGSGSLLLMLPPTQAHWRHAVPKTQKAIGPRINLTFRLVVG